MGPAPGAGGQESDVLLSPPHLLSHPVNKVLLCSERRHCGFLSVLKILQCGKLGDVESLCQGLVDGGIDSCKDTRALGWGRGQPCITASDTVPAEEEPRCQPPTPRRTCQHFSEVACPQGSYIPRIRPLVSTVYLWAEGRLLNLSYQLSCVDPGCSQEPRSQRKEGEL